MNEAPDFTSLIFLCCFLFNRLEGFFYHDKYIGNEPNEKIRKRTAKEKKREEEGKKFKERYEIRFRILLETQGLKNIAGWGITYHMQLFFWVGI